LEELWLSARGWGSKELEGVTYVGSVAAEAVAAQVLNRPYKPLAPSPAPEAKKNDEYKLTGGKLTNHTNNLRPPQIHPAKAIHITRPTGNLPLQRSRMRNHRHRLISIKLRFTIQTRQSQQRFLRILNASLADKPPGGFGGEEDADGEREGPHPLEGVGDAVGPLVGALGGAFYDADADDLAETCSC
jgi:hypothetical protein